MKKVLVTGGAGYIGSHTVVSLMEAGFEPIIVDDFSNSSKIVIPNIEKITGKNVKFYEGKVQDRELLEKLFEIEGELFGAIHFAAFKAVGESVQKPLEYYDNNLNSLMVLIDVMKEKNCMNLVFSSSCTVYGQPDQLPVTENTPRKDAESPYGNTKRISEDIISDFCRVNKNFKATSLRYFNPIGAHPSGLIGELPIGVPANLVPFITQTAIGLREKLTVFGDDYNTKDGSCIRDYIHVVDLAEAHVSAIHQLEEIETEKNYDVFNVGVGKGFSVFEVIEAFENVNEVELNYSVGPRREGDVEQIFANTDKSNRKLKWKTKLGIEDALRDAWNWQLYLKENE